MVFFKVTGQLLILILYVFKFLIGVLQLLFYPPYFGLKLVIIGGTGFFVG